MTSGESFDILNFTGNWFVDLCILGFIKILEEYYGWDLEELEKKIEEDERNVFYDYFPAAYIAFYLEKEALKVITELQRKEGEIKRKLEEESNRLKIGAKKSRKKLHQLESKREAINRSILKLENYILSLRRKVSSLKLKSMDNDKIFEAAWNTILEFTQELIKVFNECKDVSDKAKDKLKKILDNQGNLRKLPIWSDFYLNFAMFNPNFELNRQKEELKKLLRGDIAGDSEILRKFDRTINKFLFSQEEMRNITYAPTSSEPICKMLKKYPFVFLICFEAAFEFFPRLGYYVFYSPDLSFTYYVNRRLREKKWAMRRRGLLRLTWRAVIDSLYEHRARWVLEDMYIIKYGRIERQRIEEVEYIGLDKIRASLILDDKIRESLNKTLVFERTGESVWLIERFLRNDELFSYIMNYFKERVHKGMPIEVGRAHLIRALATEYSLKKTAEEEDALFGDSFFTYLANPRHHIRVFHDSLKAVSRFIRRILLSIGGGREWLASLIVMLLAPLEKLNRNAFMNMLLSELNKSEETLPWYILRRIFNSIFVDDYWQYYGLAILIDIWG